MRILLASLFSSGDFMPHGYCYLWNPGLVWLHVVSDALIALAYFSIPITLIYFIRKKRDLPFNWMFLYFGIFILACGATHAMEVWTLWHGTYWLSGAIKAVTAIASVPTAILLVQLVPQALALPSPEAMKLEIAERKRAHQALHQAKNELELGVRERTAELRKANEDLVAEIAQRTQAEDALRERERLIHAILDNSSALIFLKDKEGHYLLVNNEFERALDLTQEEIRGKKGEEVFPAEQAAAFQANDLRVIQTGVPMEFEEVALQADGLHTSIVHKFPLLDDEGKIYAIGGIATDITERKRAETESLALKDELATELVAMTRLHEFSTRLLSKAELQPLLEEILNATIALQNADFGNVQLYNSETETLEIVAYSGFQRDFLNYFAGVKETGAACGRAMQRRERVIIEDVLADPDFAPHRQIAAFAGFRAVQSTPLFSRTGEPLGMISTHFRQTHRPSARDLRFTDFYARLAAELVERRRAEEALRASEERFRRYFELGLIGMAMTSPTKGILEINDELCGMLGYERRELLKKSWAEMTHQDDLAPDVVQFNRVIAGEIDGYTLDKRWIRKDGRVIDTIMSAKCLRRADGSVDYFVGLVQDITERKRSEQALRAVQTQLVHMARVTTMGELTSSIAHEVNQPLAAVVTNGDACLRWLGNDPPNLDRARESVAGIIKEANRASEVIKRIRALAKKTPPQKTVLGVNEAIEETIDLVGAELARHHVLLLKELVPDLPAVFGDRVQLQQVILNLIANSIEAMEAVTERPRELFIGSKSIDDNRVLISVSDCGTGIGPESVDHLFEAFFTTKQEGMGLGLSISRTIVEGHGGRLSAIANKPYGATFQFTLPVAMAVGVSA
jgi:PAS domain S-box-containing protein